MTTSQAASQSQASATRVGKRWTGRNVAARARARQMVMLWGWNATAYQILNPGVRLWFSRNGAAVIGYVLASRVRIVAGAPICEHSRLPEVVREFEASARRRRERVCYFGASQRLEELLKDDAAYSHVVLGAQPVWDPRGWAEIVAGHTSLRSQIRRARKKGVRVAEWNPEQARSSQSLHACAREWIQSRGLPPLHFLVEPRVLDDLGQRRLWVALSSPEEAERAEEEIVVAFVVASPVPARGGWLLEQFVRSASAPNGAVELLIDQAMRSIGEEGATFVTMGLAPLCQLCREPDEAPPWLRLVLTGVRAHARRFYNFDGLEAFKSKMRPHFWEPIWAVSREKTFSPRTLWAVMGAFGRQPPARLLSHAVVRAALQEWRWWRARERSQKLP